MVDPYKVLGIPPTASDEQVKSAYRELARKYHPDNYVNNPLADLATEKMKEINEAYDEIQRIRRQRSSSGYSGQQSYQQGGYQQGGYQQAGSSQFSDVRRLILNHRISDAEEILDGVPLAQRDAEWYFLKGNVLYTRGWLDGALNHFTQAHQMDPNNPEYQMALNQLAWQQRTGRPAAGGYHTNPTVVTGCSPCDVCNSLICADCCCECMGGDLIRCC